MEHRFGYFIHWLIVEVGGFAEVLRVRTRDVTIRLIVTVTYRSGGNLRGHGVRPCVALLRRGKRAVRTQVDDGFV